MDRHGALLAAVPKQLLIDGSWQPAASGETFATINPATGGVLASVARAGAPDVERAVAAARRAFDGPWSRCTPFERQALLLRFCDLVESRWDDLCLLDTLEMGVPYGRARLEALGRLRFCAGLATALHGETLRLSAPGEWFSYTLSEPVGVVAAITAWNGPLPATIWKLGPVLATGCTMVLKPSEEASLTALLLAQLALEAGVPAGVINVLTGDGKVGAALVDHPGVDKIAFTGSSETGKAIARAAAGTMKRLSLELGGKSPHVIFADADLDAAAEAAAMGVFANTGQVCCAGTRVFIEKPVYAEVTARIARIARSLKVGNGLDPGVQIGPLVSAKQLARVTRYLDVGRAEGAALLAGGARLTGAGHEAGFFVAPTVFADVQDSMTIAREEIFGPVLSALPFSGVDEVVERANDTRFGLAAGVWTRDIGKAHGMAARLRAGSVWVNCYNVFDAALPFGGYKESGYGRESGIQQLREYLQVKAVTINVAAR
jgi:aldehyde dehydrogenase (NAD+)